MFYERKKKWKDGKMNVNNLRLPPFHFDKNIHHNLIYLKEAKPEGKNYHQYF